MRDFLKYSVSFARDVEALPRDANSIHMARPLKLLLLKKIAVKGVREVCAADSTLKRLSRKSIEFLKGQEIAVKRQTARGRPIGIGMQKMLEVIEMRRDMKSLRKIEEATDVPKSTVHYLVRHAGRGKIKVKGNVVHLK